MGGDGGEDGEVGGGVGGGGMYRIRYFIQLITLLGENFMIYSSLSRGSEIKGLVSSFSLPSFL